MFQIIWFEGLMECLSLISFTHFVVSILHKNERKFVIKFVLIIHDFRLRRHSYSGVFIIIHSSTHPSSTHLKAEQDQTLDWLICQSALVMLSCKK